MANRIAELMQLQKEDPSDPFFIYALAIEYEKDNNIEKCFSHLETLVKDYPNYSGTYLKYAQLLIENNNEELAKMILEQGINLAQKLNKSKMKGELLQLLEDIE
jgi:predicted Zn-dependent protease